MRSTQRIANNAWSLLHNLNTNTAECYNSLVAKFVGAKRINFSQKGSYEIRCHAAAVSFNNPANYHKLIQLYKKKRIRCAGPDFNYGLNIDDNPDMERDSYEKLKNTFLKNLYSVDIAEVERNTRDQSLSELWIRERKIRLTASNFGRIFSIKQKTITKYYIFLTVILKITYLHRKTQS
ncbi:hypothetical protein RN001_012240 [Aquatica leii]|uniref:Uncharacterized protein n=1 Tax=Aquatica leii TaxID=1421715 RepID=A0AAN7SMD2_9COLE|nr:hypothetical protein RN001_012240 [Aquatica leii]